MLVKWTTRAVKRRPDAEADSSSVGFGEKIVVVVAAAVVVVVVVVAAIVVAVVLQYAFESEMGSLKRVLSVRVHKINVYSF